MRIDPTFSADAAYGSLKWCASRLGRSVDWLRDARSRLEREGFPEVDPLLGLTLKADVEAFLARRRRVADPVSAAQHDSRDSNTGARYENL